MLSSFHRFPAIVTLVTALLSTLPSGLAQPGGGPQPPEKERPDAKLLAAARSFRGLLPKVIDAGKDTETVQLLLPSGKPFSGWGRMSGPSGKPQLLGHYRNGFPDGKSWTWHANGELESIEYHKNDKAHGRHLMWHPNGQIAHDALYQNGQFHGKVTIWYANGQLRQQAQFTEGKSTGLVRVWHENGQIAQEQQYRNGTPIDGKVVTFHDNGRLSSQLHYKDGKRNGVATFWFENGERRQECFFRDGQFHRKLTTWTESGTLEDTVYFDNGKQVARSAVPPPILDLVEDLDGEILGDYPTRIEIDLTSSEVDAATQRRFSELVRLDGLTLTGEEVCDEALEGVAEIEGLRSLVLGDVTDVTDKGIAFLANHPSLETLIISSLHLTEECVESVASIKTLSRLSLQGVSGEAYQRLQDRLSKRAFPSHKDKRSYADLSAADAAEIHELVITEDLSESLQFLTRGPNIRKLHVHARGEEFALDRICALTQLDELRLYSSALMDSQWQQLAQIGSLSHLHLHDVKLSPAAIEALASMTQLRTLSIRKSKLTEVTVQELIDRLSDCHVVVSK